MESLSGLDLFDNPASFASRSLYSLFVFFLSLCQSTSQKHVASSLEKQIGESFCVRTSSLQRRSSAPNMGTDGLASHPLEGAGDPGEF